MEGVVEGSMNAYPTYTDPVAEEQREHGVFNHFASQQARLKFALLIISMEIFK